jgi:hypothetical protein
MKRKLFSQKDGTTILEDLKGIFSDIVDSVRFFFIRIFTQLDNWYEIVGEPVVMFLEGLKEAIKKGTFSGNVFDTIVGLIPGTLDDNFLEWLRNNITEIIEEWKGIPGTLDDAEDALNELLDEIEMLSPAQTNNTYNGIASLIIDKYSREVAKESGVAPVIGRDADALAQLSYNLYRDSV